MPDQPDPSALLAALKKRLAPWTPEVRCAVADLRAASDVAACAASVLSDVLARPHRPPPAACDAYASASDVADRELRRAALAYAAASLRAAGESGTSSACVLLEQMAGEL